MSKKITKRKKERQKQAKINLCIDLLISFFVIIVPLIAIILHAFGVNIPKIAVGIYVSAVFIVAGILIIAFTCLEKFRFGESGKYFNKLTGWKHLTKKEAKANTGVFGGVMLVIGLFFAIMTVIYC